MTTGSWKRAALFAALLPWPHAALAGGLGGGDAPVLRCVVRQCQPAEDCRTPYKLGDVSFSADAGSDFLFPVSSAWTVTPERFRLEDRRYVGDSYLTRTTVNMDIDRASGAMRLVIDFEGSGATSRKAVASGSCEAVDTVPLSF